MAKSNKSSNSVTVTNTASRRAANIVMFVVIGLAALILIAVAVLSAVRIDPIEKIGKPARYDFYDAGGESSTISVSGDDASALRVALDKMDFSIMSAILQGHWDYSYNFILDAEGEKDEILGAQAFLKTPGENEYMVEFVYDDVKNDRGTLDMSTAQSIEVDGETVYFDRLKVIIGNTDGKIGTITMWPYIDARTVNTSTDDEFSAVTYYVTGITVRADTTETYAALAQYANGFKRP